MRFIAIVFSLLFVQQAYSQEVSKDKDALKKKNDSIMQILQTLVTDQSDSSDQPTDSSSSSTSKDSIATRNYSIKAGRGTVQISTSEGGQLVKAVYENESKEKPKKRNPNIYWDSYMDLGYNRVMEKESDMPEFPSLRNNKSVSFAFYPCLVGYKLLGDNVGVMTGIGMEWFNFRFSGNRTLQEVNKITTEVPVSDVFEGVDKVSKSKLTASYLNIPILFKILLPTKKRQLYFVGGVVASANIGYHTKIKYGSQKEKNSDNLNLSPFRFGLTARAGYGIVGFFASYYTTPLFQNNKGPKVYPYTIGLTISIF